VVEQRLNFACTLLHLAKTTTHVARYPRKESAQGEKADTESDKKCRHLSAEFSRLLHDECCDTARHTLRLIVLPTDIAGEFCQV